MKKRDNIIRFFAIIILSLIPLLISVYYYSFNEDFQNDEFLKYGVVDKFPEVNKFNHGVLEYLKGRGEMPTSISLNERELSHMSDVRSIYLGFILTLKIIGIVSILSLAYFLRDKTIFFQIFRYAGAFSFFLALLLLGVFSLGFDTSFDVFHTFFFKEGTWLFYAEDNLISAYTSGFFYDISIRIFVLNISLSLLLIVIGYFGKSLYRKKGKKGI